MFSMTCCCSLPLGQCARLDFAVCELKCTVILCNILVSWFIIILHCDVSNPETKSGFHLLFFGFKKAIGSRIKVSTEDSQQPPTRSKVTKAWDTTVSEALLRLISHLP